MTICIRPSEIYGLIPDSRLPIRKLIHTFVSKMTLTTLLFIELLPYTLHLLCQGVPVQFVGSERLEQAR